MPKRIMEGVVVSNKMDKTAVVKVERTFIHPLFKKTVRKSKRYHAHDQNNAAQIGQHVGRVGGAHGIFHQLYVPVAGIDVDAGGLVLLHRLH